MIVVFILLLGFSIRIFKLLSKNHPSERERERERERDREREREREIGRGKGLYSVEENLGFRVSPI